MAQRKRKTLIGILTSILVSAVAGWLDDLIFKRFSFLLLVEILLGIVDGFVFGKSTVLVDAILTSFAGAVAILGIAPLIKGNASRA